MATIHNGSRYEVRSQRNGLFVTLIRKRDSASVFLQGDDASQFWDDLDRGREIEDLCADYDDVMKEGEPA